MLKIYLKKICPYTRFLLSNRTFSLLGNNEYTTPVREREKEKEREKRGGIAVFESSAVIDCTYQQRGTIQKVSPLPGQAKEIPKRRTHRSGPRFSTGRADFSMQLPATMTLVKRSERENAGVTSNMEEWNLKFRLFRFSI